MGASPYEGISHRMSRTPGTLRSPAPILGQDNDEIFREMLSLAPDEIEQLKQEKVIF
jgi:crotonobetainyl-CoA:carnitine CoA-transferase CaiB-like acyl-CoA transferase